MNRYICISVAVVCKKLISHSSLTVSAVTWRRHASSGRRPRVGAWPSPVRMATFEGRKKTRSLGVIIQDMMKDRTGHNHVITLLKQCWLKPQFWSIKCLLLSGIKIPNGKFQDLSGKELPGGTTTQVPQSHSGDGQTENPEVTHHRHRSSHFRPQNAITASVVCLLASCLLLLLLSVSLLLLQPLLGVVAPLSLQ